MFLKEKSEIKSDLFPVPLRLVSIHDATTVHSHNHEATIEPSLSLNRATIKPKPQINRITNIA